MSARVTRRFLGAVGLSASLLLSLTACAAESRVPVPAKTAGHIATQAEGPSTVKMWTASMYNFDTLAEMVATSDLVVEGEVMSDSRGDIHVGHGGSVDHLAYLRVLETFKGATPVNVAVVEPGWDDQGRAYVVDGLPSLRPSNRVLLFLRRLNQDGSADLYVRVSSAGQFFLDGDSVTTGEAVDAAVEKIKTMTSADLRVAIRQAGRVEPVRTAVPGTDPSRFRSQTPKIRGG